MDERTQERILDKVEYIRGAVSVLVDVRDTTTFEEYETDRRTRSVVEREFQTAIEACIDIGEMILSARGESVPERNADVFRHLQSLDVLHDETADRMVRAAKFRNVIAHQYGDDIDDGDVFRTLNEDLDVFSAYLADVRAVLGE